jgi:hypothetical protein
MGVDFGATNLWADNPKLAQKHGIQNRRALTRSLERPFVSNRRNLTDASII